jgi:rhodanese-related sulfurtransferase
MFDWLQRIFRQAGEGPAWIEYNELLRRGRWGSTTPMIIDVREPDEFDGPLGHIQGALNIPLAALSARAEQLAGAGCPIVLVCLTDKRSSQAATELAAAGARDVWVLRGGMKAWRGRW